MRLLYISAIAATVLSAFSLPIYGSSFVVKSQQFEDGDLLPEAMVYQGFGCTGDNMSPQLSWHNPPEGTKSYVVTMYDPDAPTGVGWWHWSVFNIPGDVLSLSPDADDNGNLPLGSQQGYTDFGDSEYGGACPPKGDRPHNYIFTVYALDLENLPADAATTGAKLSYLIKDHILAKASITAKFGR